AVEERGFAVGGLAIQLVGLLPIAAARRDRRLELLRGNRDRLLRRAHRRQILVHLGERRLREIDVAGVRLREADRPVPPGLLFRLVVDRNRRALLNRVPLLEADDGLDQAEVALAPDAALVVAAPFARVLLER